MNYQNGKIYCIRSHQTDKIYIGSTCSPLHKRFYDHRKKYKCWKNNKYGYTSSYELMEYEDVYIELLEEYPCNNKMELCKKEGEYIRSMDCVNKMKRPFITEEENKQRNKEYAKEYRKNNIETIKEKKNKYMKEYSLKLENKQKKSEYDKERRKIKIQCECGGKYTQSHKTEHEKTKKHIKYIESL